MSASSGIHIPDEIVKTYKDLQAHHKHPFMLFKVSDDNSQVEVDLVGEAGQGWDDLVTAIPEKECRYAVYDCKFTTKEGGIREKVVFCVWNPDDAKIKQKMVYASTKDALKKKLEGVAVEKQCNAKSDLNLEELVEDLRAKTK